MTKWSQGHVLFKINELNTCKMYMVNVNAFWFLYCRFIYVECINK